MSKSYTQFLPMLRDTLNYSAGSTIVIRAGWRVYIFKHGCYCYETTTTPTTEFDTAGLGEFEANDYVLPCAATAYGSGALFIPDTERVSRVSSVSATDDGLLLTTDVSLTKGDYLLNLGSDSNSPTASVLPAYDGSGLSLYTYNTTREGAQSDPYFVSSSKGEVVGYLEPGRVAVDLMLTDSSGTPQVVIPNYTLNEEILD